MDGNYQKFITQRFQANEDRRIISPQKTIEEDWIIFHCWELPILRNLVFDGWVDPSRNLVFDGWVDPRIIQSEPGQTWTSSSVNERARKDCHEIGWVRIKWNVLYILPYHRQGMKQIWRRFFWAWSNNWYYFSMTVESLSKGLSRICSHTKWNFLLVWFPPLCWTCIPCLQSLWMPPGVPSGFLGHT